MKKPIVMKGLVVAVLFLFLGVAVAPSINANVVESEMVKLEIEVSDLGKKHTVSLTQQEADEVELLFDDIEQRLSEVETREEAELIFKEAIVELDRYGLLGGLSVRQAQKLVTSGYKDEKVIEFLERNPDFLEDDENLFCVIVGNTDATDIYGLINNINYNLGLFVLGLLIQLYLKDLDMLFLAFVPIYILLGILFLFNYHINPFKFFTNMYMGGDTSSANGWVYTIGIKGIISWNGSFKGEIDNGTQLGVRGFTGLIVRHNKKPTQPWLSETFYLGYALRVKLG
jgi:hypothetical protein